MYLEYTRTRYNDVQLQLFMFLAWIDGGTHRGRIPTAEDGEEEGLGDTGARPEIRDGCFDNMLDLKMFTIVTCIHWLNTARMDPRLADCQP